MGDYEELVALGSDGVVYSRRQGGDWVRHRGVSAWLVYYQNLLPQSDTEPWFWYVEAVSPVGYRMMAVLGVHSNV